MSLSALTPQESEVVRKAIVKVVHDLEVEVHTRLGVTPDAIEKILALWPEVDDSDDHSDACVVINNALNDLLYGIGISDRVSREIFGVPRAELEAIYQKWAKSRGWFSTGVC